MQTIKTILVFVILMFLLCAGLVYSGVYNVAADVPHLQPVNALLGMTRSRSIAVRMDNISAPDNLYSQERVERGGKLYGNNCAGCHLGPGQPETGLYKGLNPKPPHLVQHGGQHESRKLFWIIKHGIKMTAMPAWGLSHSEQELWDVTAFVMQLPDLSEEEFRAYTTGTPKSF